MENYNKIARLFEVERFYKIFALGIISFIGDPQTKDS